MSEDPDLVAWLRVQLDEDERVAREAGRDSWVAVDRAFVDDSNGRQVVRDECMASGTQAHIARHDPARVLRRIEADRRILDLHDDDGGAHECPAIDSVVMKGERYTAYERECLTLRLLALPYAAREGFRAEWRPAAAGDRTPRR